MFDPEVLLKQLADLGRELDAASEKLADLDLLATGAGVEASRLKEAYDDAVAEAYLHTEGPVEARKMQARQDAAPVRKVFEEAHRDAELAKSQLRGHAAMVKAILSRIDIGRSLLSHEKSRMELDRLPEPRRP